MNHSYFITKKDNHSYIKIQKKELDDINVINSLKSDLLVIINKGEKNIILDLNKSTKLNSDFISSIAIANRLCKSVNGKLIITGLTEETEKLLTIAQLDDSIIMAITPEKAERILQ